MEARAEALSRPRQDEDADRRIGVDATKSGPQNAEVGRLEPVMLARPIEPHHGAAVGHADDRDCRLAADVHIIRHQSSSFRPTASPAGPWPSLAELRDRKKPPEESRSDAQAAAPRIVAFCRTGSPSRGANRRRRFFRRRLGGDLGPVRRIRRGHIIGPIGVGPIGIGTVGFRRVVGDGRTGWLGCGPRLAAVHAFGRLGSRTVSERYKSFLRPLAATI